MSHKLLLQSYKPDVSIILSNGTLFLQQNNYCKAVSDKDSLIRILPLFEMPVEVIFATRVDISYKFEDFIPIDELLEFLILEMKSSYWTDHVLYFLLDANVVVRLRDDTMSILGNDSLIGWLPQRIKHQIRKVKSKSKRNS